MTTLVKVLMWLGPLLEVGILAGLVVRRRLCHAVSLPLLLIALIASAVTVGLCPTCNTWRFWVVKEFIHAGLLLALGLELVQRAFTPGPARRAARLWAVSVLTMMVILVATSSPGRIVQELLPRSIASVAWLYTGLSIVMLRHSKRIEGLYDTILSGFAAYLIVYAALWSQAGENTRVAALVNPPVQIAVLAALLYAAWAPPRSLDARSLRHDEHASTRRMTGGPFERLHLQADEALP